MRILPLLLLSGLLPLVAQTYRFSDGGKPVRVEFAPNEVLVKLPRGTDRAAAMAKAKKALGAHWRNSSATGDGVLVTLSQPATRDSFGAAGLDGISLAPVFYDLADDAKSRHTEAARRILTSRLLVRFDESKSAAQWSSLQSATKALGRNDSVLGGGWMLVSYHTPYDALDAAVWMTNAGNWEFTPVFARQFQAKQPRATAPLQRPVNDPLFGKQWHLANEGPGIRMNGSWDLATGRGINVAVVDDGVDIAHEDLVGNAYAYETGNHHNFNEGDPNNPSPADPEQTHGTNCAGLVGAQGFNNRGVIGVAPEARLMGLRLIAGPASDDDTATAMLWQPNGLETHVSSNSWGPPDDAKNLGRISALHLKALERATSERRGGLGTVFCVSAGNGRGAGDNASYDAFSSSRFVIGVGAVNRNGEPSSYSERGVNVAVSALGGEFDPPGVIWTTNNSGEAALGVLRGKFESSQAPVDYTDAFNGTSAAAPQVSGAAALLLQHNPRLSYRDVKEILMRTATRAGLQNGDEFARNGGGFFFSHSFGAGLINVSAALDMAATWTPLGPLTSISANSGDRVAPIPDGTIEGAEFKFDFSGGPSLRVESVEVEVNVNHAKRGDVGFIITSPSGMVSVVENRTPDDGANFENFVLTSVRHWGESSTGVWSVRVVDIEKNGVAGAAGAIAVRLFGVAR